MQFKKILLYKLKSILPILGVAGVGVVSSCEKVGPTERPEDKIPTTSVNIEMYGSGVRNPVDYYAPIIVPMVRAYAKQEYIDSVYITATGQWGHCAIEDITNLRLKVLEPAINGSEKVHGRGNFEFYPGLASKVPDDSTWFVKHGWTLNQQQR